jgi:hypothetical protein
MKPRQLLLLLAALGAAALLLFDGAPSGEDIAAPVAREARRAAPATGQTRSDKAAAEPALLALRERHAGTRGAGGEGRLFAETSWAPPPSPPKAAAAPPPPVAPPLPFTYVGRQVQGGAEEVFLAEGDKLHVVRAGSVIAGSYRVEAVAAKALTLIYLPLNQTQQLLIRATE